MNWNRKPSDFWGACGAGIAGVTGVATAGNYIRKMPSRRRAELIRKRRIHQEIQTLFESGKYTIEARDKAFAEQEIDPVYFVGQPSDTRSSKFDVVNKNTTQLLPSMEVKSTKSTGTITGSSMSSISLSNNSSSITSSNCLPRASWTNGFTNSTLDSHSNVIYNKKPIQQYIVA